MAVERLDRIVVDPSVCLGQPTVRDTRITIGVILKMLGAGKSVEEVLEAYPELVADDIRQAMRYAAWVVSDQIRVAQSVAQSMQGSAVPMIRLLADMNISPKTVDALRKAGWDVLRVSQVLPTTASDELILDYA